MKTYKVNILSSHFSDEAEAFEFAKLNFKEEPEDDATDEEWEEYDDDPYECELHDELQVEFIQPEYRETIYGESRFDYLETMLVNKKDKETVISKSRKEDNMFFLIFEMEDNIDIDLQPKSEKLKFIGQYDIEMEY